jgi:spore maturation protein CgeB
MKILFGHGYNDEGVLAVDFQRINSWLSRLRAASIDIHPIQIGLNVRGRRLPWRELDRRWRLGDRTLLSLYEDIARKVEGYDVLINAGGLSLHPDFLSQLPTFNVLFFNDDPESSDDFSRPVAGSYDLCAIGNIAEIETYKSWGVKNVRWCPHGFRADEYDPTLTSQNIITKQRDVDVSLLCERLTPYRREKVDRFALAFPQGIYRGPGWPKGFLPEPERVPLLQKTKIGINIHNSTGPINFRTYYLPANGVMQICDNKAHLGKIFVLGTEVIGYDGIEEAIEMCRYYLEHDEERREIAAAGWKRATTDYDEVSAFRFMTQAIEELFDSRSKQSNAVEILTSLTQHRLITRSRRIVNIIGLPVTWTYRQIPRYYGAAGRRLRRFLDNIKLRLRSHSNYPN